LEFGAVSAKFVRELRERRVARKIAEIYHGRPVSDEYLFGKATGGDVFVRMAKAAVSACGR
jgi:hypothetical protein